jgi:hypothetical protein
MTERVEICEFLLSVYIRKKKSFGLFCGRYMLLCIKKTWRSYLSLESVKTSSPSLSEDFLKTNRNEIPCINLFRNLPKNSQDIYLSLM